MFTSFGGRTTTRLTSRPASARVIPGAASRQVAQLGLRDVRRYLQPVADLPVHLNHAGDRLLNQERRVRGRPGGPGHGRDAGGPDRAAQHLPALLRGVRGEQRQHDGQRLRGLPHRRVGGAGARVDRLAGGADQLHQPGHGDVQVIVLHLPGDLVDDPVGDPPQVAVARRRSRGCGRGAGRGATSAAIRHTRPRNLTIASGFTSAQSMSSCGGEAKIIVSRIASTPYRPICSPRLTPLPSDLDIALPRLMHLALVDQPGERLAEVDQPQVLQHLGEEPRVQQVQDRVLDAAHVQVDGRPAVDVLAAGTARRRNAASSTGTGTTTSRRRCPSCRCPGAPGRRTSGTPRSPSRWPPPAATRPWGPGPRRAGRAARPAAAPRGPGPHRRTGSG